MGTLALQIFKVDLKERNAYVILDKINSVRGKIVSIIANVDTVVYVGGGVKELWVFYEPEK